LTPVCAQLVEGLELREALDDGFADVVFQRQMLAKHCERDG